VTMAVVFTTITPVDTMSRSIRPVIRALSPSVDDRSNFELNA